MTRQSFQIGEIPSWASRDNLVAHLQEFADVYAKRPIENNQGGQKAAQLFYSWYVAKTLKPKFIIESGVFMGQGTWAFQTASPDSKIISLDPYLDRWGGYRSESVQYIRQDFSKIDWRIIDDKHSTLCFFDDHQNAVQRLIQCHMHGFKHVMFEDNYPEGQGDCVSLKKALETDNYFLLPGASVSDYVLRLVDSYLEFPPITGLEKTRWGTEWKTYRSNEPLVENDKCLEVYREGMDQYTWINYMQVKS